MEKRKIELKDLLKDRGRIDQYGFLFFALVGGVLIVLAKYAEAESHWVAVGAVVVMALYALLINRSGSGRLRSDQAGDNCYYLGLIYTLASLAYAIFTFDPANTATTIVQGFGIALATTIVGLVLRVFFNQGRPDLEDYEERARISLTEAASQLRTQIGQVVRDMNDLSRQVRQSINETRDSAASEIETFTKSSVDGLREVVDTANEAIRGEANDFAARSKRYTLSFDKLVTTLDAHAENVGKLSDVHGAMASTVEMLSRAAATAQETIGVLASQAEHSAAGVQAVRQGSEKSLEVVQQLNMTMAQVAANLSSFHAQAEQQLNAIRSAPGEAVSNASEALARTVAQLEEQVRQLASTHRDAAQGIASQAQTSLDMTRQLNEALEAALTQSRTLVGQVHGELAHMTAELVRQVEART
jgi:DNA anti-recombination protein RmuC